MGEKLNKRYQPVPSSSRLKIFSLRGLWITLAMLLITFFLAMTALSVKQVKEDQKILLEKQIEVLSRVRSRDLERGNLRGFLEGFGEDLKGAFILAQSTQDVYLEAGKLPTLPVCVERRFVSMAWAHPLDLRVCRPLEFPLFLLSFSLVSMIALGLGTFFSIRKVENKAILGFKKLLEDRGIEINENQGLRDFLVKLEEIQSRLALARESEVRLIKLQSYSDIARQVVHDVRSPIAALAVLSDSDLRLTPDQEALFSSATRKLQEIIQDLHEKGARVENQKMSDSEREKVNLPSLLAEIKNEKTIEFKGAVKINLIFNKEFESLQVIFRSLEMSRMLSNLINNGVEAGATEVSLRLRMEENSVLLEILDNGKGIPRGQLKRVLEKGYTSGKDGGTGLGLSYAKDIMEKSGGSLSLFSEEEGGGGTRIVLRFSNF
jgi:signal transduction histidine kinase